MARKRSIIPTPYIRVDRSLPVSIEQQIYGSLRQAIREGLLRAGARVPASRLLAFDLGVSRNCVIEAYQRLITEGYLTANSGGGTFVAARQFVKPPAEPPAVPIQLSPFGHAAERMSSVISGGNAFSPIIPALDAFPRAKWSQLMQSRWRSMPLTMTGLDAVTGLGTLREAIAVHIAPMRGIVCTPEQVVITTGRRSALDCIFRVLADRGDSALIEDPCDVVVHELVTSLQLRVIAGEVDNEGLKPNSLYEQQPRIAYVTAARQYPLGMQMSLGRRYVLIEMAKKQDFMIVEDEPEVGFYDHTPQGRSLKAIDTRGRVIYTGSFGGSLSCFINLGFIIAPAGFSVLMGHARSLTGAVAGTPEQAVLAEFIRSGDFAQHMQRMKGIYDERREALRHELTHQLAGSVRAITGSGMHVVAWLSDDIDDAAISAAAARRGINAPALSSYTLQRTMQPGLILGYGATPPQEMRAAVETLARAFETGHSSQVTGHRVAAS
jgi:GntR family transcriptional regulator / MocR family aminotransferase